jgi:hypothetical protein
MELDNLVLKVSWTPRRKAVQTSIRQISTEELVSLVTEILFEDPANPWCEILHQFIKDNASSVLYQASTTEFSGEWNQSFTPHLEHSERSARSMMVLRGGKEGVSRNLEERLQKMEGLTKQRSNTRRTET